MKLSIIIPALNEEKVIERTLKSIRESEYKDYEIIVVANGCIDKTVEKSKLADRIIVTKKKGVSRARNLGASKAKGELLIFLDADISLFPETLGEITELKQPIVGTCYAKPNINNWKAKLFQSVKNSFAWYGWTNGVIIASKEVFDYSKGFNENLTKGEDGKFVRKAKKKYSFKVVGRVINDMRRFEKTGYFSSPMYWIKEYTLGHKKEYPEVR